MLDDINVIKLISMMTHGEYYMFVKYTNDDFEIISANDIHISDSMYGYNKHFYFKENNLYYWESNIIANKEKTNINVGDLYEIHINKKQINELFEKMYYELLNKLGSKYSNAFIKRKNKIYNKFTSKESTPISYSESRLEILEIQDTTIPDKLKRTEIKIVFATFLGVLDTKWNYIIDYKLIDMKKIE